MIIYIILGCIGWGFIGWWVGFFVGWLIKGEYDFPKMLCHVMLGPIGIILIPIFLLMMVDNFSIDFSKRK